MAYSTKTYTFTFKEIWDAMRKVYTLPPYNELWNITHGCEELDPDCVEYENVDFRVKDVDVTKKAKRSPK